MEKFAVAAIINDLYVEPFRVMISSFIETNSWFKGDFIVFYSEDKEDNLILSSENREKLKKEFPIIKFKEINRKYYEKAYNHMLSIMLHGFCSSFYKLELFGLEEYDSVLYLDSDILVINSLEDLFNTCKDSFFCCKEKPLGSNFDIEKNDIIKSLGVLIHPKNNTIEDEYETWINERGLDGKEKDSIINFMNSNNYDINYNGMYEVGFMIIKKDYDTLSLNSKMIELLDYFKNNGINIRVDQALFSIILNNYFSYINVMPLSHSIIQSERLRWMIHGSNLYMCTIPVNSDYGYLFNNNVKLYNF